MTLKCDLDLDSAYSYIICYVYCLTKTNIWVEFDENHSKDSGDVERT